MKDPYYRLLAAYPKSYRRERGRELVDMYREISGDRRPGVAEATDLVLGGLRERLRAAGLGGLARALPAVSVLALAALAGLSAYYLLAFELHPVPGFSFGRFASAYVCAYVGWLVTAAIAAIRPGRLARIAAALSLVLIVAALGLRFVRSPWWTLNLYMGLPLAVLGVTALALPSFPSRAARLAPVATAVAVGAAMAAHLPIFLPLRTPETGTLWKPNPETYGMCCHYSVTSSWVQILAAVGLLLAGVIATIAYARRGSRQGAWMLLLLATPVAALLETWLVTVEPIMTFLYHLTGSSQLQTLLAGLSGVVVTAIVLPLIVAGSSIAGRAYAVRRKPLP